MTGVQTCALPIWDVLLVQQVPQLLIQGLDGAVHKLNSGGPLSVRLSWSPWLLGGPRDSLVGWTLGLGGHSARRDGGGIGLLEDY